MDDRYSRLRTIDGLRGVAALGVVFYHVDGGARLSYGMVYRTREEGVEKLIRLRDATLRRRLGENGRRAARYDGPSVGRAVVVS